MRMLAYIRRSKESDEKTVSIASQREAIERYCRTNAQTITESIVDDGISGGNRSRLDKIKERILTCKLRGMVSYHLDRIARDTAAQLDLLAWFSKRGLQIHTCNQGLISIDQSHEFLSVGVQAMMNEYHRRRAIEHGISTYEKHKHADHRYSRFPPYGFTFLGNDILPVDDEQSILSVIMVMSIKLSATTIAHHLNNNRHFNRKGTPWSAGSIQRIQRRLAK